MIGMAHSGILEVEDLQEQQRYGLIAEIHHHQLREVQENARVTARVL